jgi:hypothetical protein
MVMRDSMKIANKSTEELVEWYKEKPSPEGESFEVKDKRISHGCVMMLI